jgi:hypothetical protein
VKKAARVSLSKRLVARERGVGRAAEQRGGVGRAAEQRGGVGRAAEQSGAAEDVPAGRIAA